MTRPRLPHGLRRSALALMTVAALLLLAGCRGWQSALDPAGMQAQRLYTLTQVLTWISVAVFVLVTAALFYAVFGPPRQRRHGSEEEQLPEPGKFKAVAAATTATVVILIALIVYSASIDRLLARGPAGDALEIHAIGRMWWWEFRYLDHQRPSNIVTTANELYLPAGRDVRFWVESRDVIHSFWVPSLHGKIDMIPGRTNSTWLRAQRPGVYRGQCAEFCGLQHALMAFITVVVPEDEFEAWLEHQRRPAAEPVTEEQRRGRQVFLQSTCVMCHTVRGTRAQGKVAPDLTHFASRRTIAAGTLPNTRGHLGGWIADPQSIKPGNFMPATVLEPESFQALLSYLESLK